MGYTLKTTNTYRVPTVEDALALRKYLERTCIGELTAFKYTTKYIKMLNIITLGKCKLKLQ